MKRLLFLLIAVWFVSCSNEKEIPPEDDSCHCKQLPEEYLTCEQLLDTTGLKLYKFAPFTDEWGPGKTPYLELVASRQIPEDFMAKMTSKELFYQFVYCDLSKSMGLFNTVQQGFEAITKQLNMLPELLNRSNAGYILLEILKQEEFEKIEELNDFWFFHCLQIILAQAAVINRMTDENIDNYIQQQMRCHDNIRELSATNNNWECPGSLGITLFGHGNVMIRYKFDPFMQLLKTNQYCSGLMTTAMIKDEQTALLIIDCIENFKK